MQNKPVKQEVNGTVILPPLVFPGKGIHVCSKHVSTPIGKRGRGRREREGGRYSDASPFVFPDGNEG